MTKKKVSKNMKEDQALKKLGNRIRELRIKAGYQSGEKFALDNKFSRVVYGRWESGNVNIKYVNLLALAKAFDITVSELLEGLD